jgi:hypothetical protein
MALYSAGSRFALASFAQSALWSLGYGSMALLALAVTVPLWLLPPLVS